MQRQSADWTDAHYSALFFILLWVIVQCGQCLAKLPLDWHCYFFYLTSNSSAQDYSTGHYACVCTVQTIKGYAHGMQWFWRDLVVRQNTDTQTFKKHLLAPGKITQLCSHYLLIYPGVKHNRWRYTYSHCMIFFINSNFFV